MYKFFLILFVLSTNQLDCSHKKRISDKSYRYEFFTVSKNIKARPERYYHWFKGGAIHTSQYGIGGEVLHQTFTKFYLDNQLAEIGEFDNGLKVGYWKSWYKNGVLQSMSYWKDGQMNGSYILYDVEGNVVETGKYKKNKKQGEWINQSRHDTLQYRRGKLLIKTEKKRNIESNSSKRGIFSKLIVRKKKDTLTMDSSMRKKGANNKKQGLFKRVFTNRKDKSKDSDKQLKKKN